MQKLQCAVSNSVSHFIVILIYTNCFHVCAHAFDEHAAPPLCPLAPANILTGATNASSVKSPLWHMKS